MRKNSRIGTWEPFPVSRLIYITYELKNFITRFFYNLKHKWLWHVKTEGGVLTVNNKDTAITIAYLAEITEKLNKIKASIKDKK